MGEVVEECLGKERALRQVPEEGHLLRAGVLGVKEAEDKRTEGEGSQEVQTGVSEVEIFARGDESKPDAQLVEGFEEDKLNRRSELVAREELKETIHNDLDSVMKELAALLDEFGQLAVGHGLLSALHLEEVDEEGGERLDGHRRVQDVQSHLLTEEVGQDRDQVAAHFIVCHRNLLHLEGLKSPEELITVSRPRKGNEAFELVSEHLVLQEF